MFVDGYISFEFIFIKFDTTILFESFNNIPMRMPSDSAVKMVEV